MNLENNISKIIKKMNDHGLPQVAIDNFKHHFMSLTQSTSSFVDEKDIKPVTNLPSDSDLNEQHLEQGQKAMKKTALLKLNGGLGTSMGLNQAKSLIKIKGENNFLDVIAKQCIQAEIPLVLMNSFNTNQDTLNHLKQYDALEIDKNLYCFDQHKIPRIKQEGLEAFSASDANADWCPPGHGDLYPALLSSGALDKLLDDGYEYVFVSNSDNLGAVIDEKLLGYFAAKDLPFMMEVCKRTQNDKKGGHLALNASGNLMLREIAQCSDDDLDSFQDITKHSYFNTNNIWINLKALKDKLNEHNNVLPLDLICNSKKFPDANQNETAVFQLETAMGAAISLFEGAEAMCVDRKRFIPVKTTADLLRTRSNLFDLNDEFKLVTNAQLTGALPKITLDDKFYKIMSDYEERFQSGEPDLIQCDELLVQGDIVFGQNIRIEGSTEMKNQQSAQVTLDDNEIFTGTYEW